jgi:hypothetical protein
MICIAGHVGVGHVFSHSGFVQDDSQGFAVVGHMIKDLFKVRTKIESVDVDLNANVITIKTKDGGVGQGRPRRGITPFEAEMLKHLEGEEGLFPHYATLKVFGRFYGHGVSEVPVATEYAISTAVMDTFAKNIPEFYVARREDEIASDVIGGVKVKELSTAFLLTINGSKIGVGPVENLEGNVALPPKRGVMERLGVLRSPTIVVESKAYVPSLRVDRELFLVRYNQDVDNVTVAKSIISSLEEFGADYLEIPSAFPMEKGAMEKSVREVAERIITHADKLKTLDSAIERAKIIAELVKILSEDVGGIIFMDNKLHDIVRAAGIMPGTAAVFSKVVPEEYIQKYKVVFTTKDDVGAMSKVLKRAIEVLLDKYPNSIDEIKEKFVDVL